MHYVFAHMFLEEAVFEEVRMSDIADVEILVKEKRHCQRLDWDDMRVNVMRKALTQMVMSRNSLREALLASDCMPIIHAHNKDDSFWGVGSGDGENVVGQLLSDLRDDLRTEDSNQADIPNKMIKESKRGRRKPPKSALHHADGTVTFDMVSSDTVRVTITDEELFVPMSAIPQKAKTLAHKYQWKKKYNRVDRQPDSDDEGESGSEAEEDDEELACYMYRRPEVSEQLSGGAATVEADESKLQMLLEMGFADRSMNLTALLQADGDVSLATRLLLQGGS